MTKRAVVVHDRKGNLRGAKVKEKEGKQESGDFPRPLKGRLLFLDLPGFRGTATLEKDLKLLGATIEKCFSKEVSVLITNKGKPEDYDKSKKTTAANSAASPAISTPSPFNLGQEKGGVHSPQADSPANVDPKNTSKFSRGKAIAQKVDRTQTYGSTNVVQNAITWGVKICHIEVVQKWLKKEIEKVPASARQQVQQVKPAAKQPKVRKLRAPFIKFESSDKHYKPVQQEYPQFPHVQYNTKKGSCPFDRDRGHGSPPEGQEEKEHAEVEGAEREQKGQEEYHFEGEDTEKARLIFKSKRPPSPKKGISSAEILNTPGRLMTAGELRRFMQAKKKAIQRRGYCELCQVRYDDLRTHVRSNQHKQFADKSENYMSLDLLINRGPNMAQFLDDVIKYHAMHQQEGLEHGVMQMNETVAMENRQLIASPSTKQEQSGTISTAKNFKKSQGDVSTLKSSCTTRSICTVDSHQKKDVSVKQTQKCLESVDKNSEEEKMAQVVGSVKDTGSKTDIKVADSEVKSKEEYRQLIQSDAGSSGSQEVEQLKCITRPETGTGKELKRKLAESSVGVSPKTLNNKKRRSKHEESCKETNRQEVQDKTNLKPCVILTPLAPDTISWYSASNRSSVKGSINPPDLPSTNDEQLQTDLDIDEGERKHLSENVHKQNAGSQDAKMLSSAAPGSNKSVTITGGKEGSVPVEITEVECTDIISAEGTPVETVVTHDQKDEQVIENKNAEAGPKPGEENFSETKENTSPKPSASNLVGETSNGESKEKRTRKVKLKKNWSILSERSMRKVIKSEGTDPFDGFPSTSLETGKDLPTDLTYVELSELEVEVNSEVEWIYSELEQTEVGKHDEKKNLELIVKHVDADQMISESSSNWGEMLDDYLDNVISREKNTSAQRSLNAKLVSADEMDQTKNAENGKEKGTCRSNSRTCNKGKKACDKVESKKMDGSRENTTKASGGKGHGKTSKKRQQMKTRSVEKVTSEEQDQNRSAVKHILHSTPVRATRNSQSKCTDIETDSSSRLQIHPKPNTPIPGKEPLFSIPSSPIFGSPRRRAHTKSANLNNQEELSPPRKSLRLSQLNTPWSSSSTEICLLSRATPISPRPTIKQRLKSPAKTIPKSIKAATIEESASGSMQSQRSWLFGSKEGVEQADDDIEFNFSSPQKSKNSQSPAHQHCKSQVRCSPRLQKFGKKNLSEKLRSPERKKAIAQKKVTPKKRLLKCASSVEKSFNLGFMMGSKSLKQNTKSQKKSHKQSPVTVEGLAKGINVSCSYRRTSEKNAKRATVNTNNSVGSPPSVIKESITGGEPSRNNCRKMSHMKDLSRVTTPRSPQTKQTAGKATKKSSEIGKLRTSPRKGGKAARQLDLMRSAAQNSKTRSPQKSQVTSPVSNDPGSSWGVRKSPRFSSSKSRSLASPKLAGQGKKPRKLSYQMDEANEEDPYIYS